MIRLASILLASILLAGVLYTPAAQVQADDDLSQELIAALNAWRLDEGLWPFQVNPTLNALAQSQAFYLSGLADLPDNLHAGPDGLSPPERAHKAPYNWPAYGRPDRVAIGEIAYIGATVRSALTWWSGSAIHTRTVMNPGYREIGVGLAPHPYGYVMIVVVGAQPNVLPAQIDASAGLLYLADEKYTWAGNDPAWIHAVTQVRLLDAAGQPLDGDWIDWSPTLTLSPGAEIPVSVEFADGASIVVTAVSPVLLPHTLALAAEVPQPEVAEPVPEAAGVPTPEHHAVAAPDDTLPVDETPDVRIVYDKVSLAVLNVSAGALDLSGLVLRSPDGTFAFTIWRTQWLTAPLEAFPAGDCLHAWGWNDVVDPAPPAACGYVRSAITISPVRRFWTTTDFDVMLGNMVIARCAADAGECTFALP